MSMHLSPVLERLDSLTTNRSLEMPCLRTVELPVPYIGRAFSVRIITRSRRHSTVNSRTVSWSKERTRGPKPSTGPMTMAGLALIGTIPMCCARIEGRLVTTLLKSSRCRTFTNCLWDQGRSGPVQEAQQRFWVDGRPAVSLAPFLASPSS